MAQLEKLDIITALPLWEELALNNVDEPNIALNPHLFDFFHGYLKLTPYYIILYKGETPIGLFPLVLDGNRFCSLPHLSHGGIFRIRSTKAFDSDEDIFSQVISCLNKQKPKPGFYKFHIADSDDKLTNTSIDLEIRNDKSYFEETESTKSLPFIPIKSSYEDQFELFGSNLRRKITKAAKNGIVVKKGGANLISDFTKVYNRNIQRIGSPTLGITFFASLAGIQEVQAEVFVAYYQNQPIGCGFCMWYDGYYENNWFSTLSKYNNLYTSYLLHAEMIKSAILKKAKIYSLGRSTKGTGVHQYKLQWPVEEMDLYFSKTLKSGFSLKDQKWMSAIWKQLPGPLVDLIGPYFAKKMH